MRTERSLFINAVTLLALVAAAAVTLVLVGLLAHLQGYYVPEYIRAMARFMLPLY